ncbi:hypothetical protein A3Q56_04017 [Intoshia linei]|uniref:Uncharacterized protein n=1 Tax=Intoshia linei TaxID=1819745 RepID=A0A177B3R0_9BILA|nr:hypothetical protein A3Q56_04017 [Intoshia linei]
MSSVSSNTIYLEFPDLELALADLEKLKNKFLTCKKWPEISKNDVELINTLENIFNGLSIERAKVRENLECQNIKIGRIRKYLETLPQKIKNEIEGAILKCDKLNKNTILSLKKCILDYDKLYDLNRDNLSRLIKDNKKLSNDNEELYIYNEKIINNYNSILSTKSEHVITLNELKEQANSLNFDCHDISAYISEQKETLLSEKKLFRKLIKDLTNEILKYTTNINQVVAFKKTLMDNILQIEKLEKISNEKCDGLECTINEYQCFINDYDILNNSLNAKIANLIADIRKYKESNSENENLISIEKFSFDYTQEKFEKDFQSLTKNIEKNQKLVDNFKISIVTKDGENKLLEDKIEIFNQNLTKIMEQLNMYEFLHLKIKEEFADVSINIAVIQKEELKYKEEYSQQFETIQKITMDLKKQLEEQRGVMSKQKNNNTEKQSQYDDFMIKLDEDRNFMMRIEEEILQETNHLRREYKGNIEKKNNLESEINQLFTKTHTQNSIIDNLIDKRNACEKNIEKDIKLHKDKIKWMNETIELIKQDVIKNTIENETISQNRNKNFNIFKNVQETLNGHKNKKYLLLSELPVLKKNKEIMIGQINPLQNKFGEMFDDRKLAMSQEQNELIDIETNISDNNMISKNILNENQIMFDKNQIMEDTINNLFFDLHSIRQVNEELNDINVKGLKKAYESHNVELDLEKQHFIKYKELNKLNVHILTESDKRLNILNNTSKKLKNEITLLNDEFRKYNIV